MFAFTGGQGIAAVSAGFVIPVNLIVDTVVQLPPAFTVAEGTKVLIRELNRAGTPGQPGEATMRNVGGVKTWQIEQIGGPPTISEVGKVGVAPGELPITYTVGVGADLVLGNGVVFDTPERQVYNPADVATRSNGEYTLNRGAGVWRLLANVVLESPAGNAAIWEIWLQRQPSGGGGWSDYGPVRARVDTNSLTDVNITEAAIAINEFFFDDDQFRFVMRHKDMVLSRDIELHSLQFAFQGVRMSTA